MARLEQKKASRAEMALSPARPAAIALMTRLPARPLMTTLAARLPGISPSKVESMLYPTEGLVQYDPVDTSNPAIL